jgi:hypothetical protein
VGEAFELIKQQDEALINNLSHAMVYLLHQAPGVPTANGTAVLVRRGGYTYIASALHNFDPKRTEDPEVVMKTWDRTTFNFRDGGTLKLHHNPSLPDRPRLDPGTKLTGKRFFLRNEKFDLIALRLAPSEMIPADARPIELQESQYAGEIRTGEALITIGTPFEGAIQAPTGHRVLYPHKFEVPYDPEVPKPRIPNEYKSNNYLLYPYANHLEGVGPGGYSGAPVWSLQETEAKALWSVKPMIVGIVLRHFETANLILAVRIQHLIALLGTDSASSEDRPGGVA